MRYILWFSFIFPTLFAYGQEEELSPEQSWEQTKILWEKFDDYKGAFTIQTPGPFQEKIDSVKTAIGLLAYHTFYFRPPSEVAENEFYMVSYVDYPTGAIHHDSIDLVRALFDETQEAAVASMRGELLFSRDGQSRSFPFRYWRIDYLNGRASIRTKAYVANNRFYTVQTVTRREYGMNKSTDRFIDSFHIF